MNAWRRHPPQGTAGYARYPHAFRWVAAVIMTVTWFVGSTSLWAVGVTITPLVGVVGAHIGSTLPRRIAVRTLVGCALAGLFAIGISGLVRGVPAPGDVSFFSPMGVVLLTRSGTAKETWYRVAAVSALAGFFAILIVSDQLGLRLFSGVWALLALFPFAAMEAGSEIYEESLLRTAKERDGELGPGPSERLYRQLLLHRLAIRLGRGDS